MIISTNNIARNDNFERLLTLSIRDLMKKVQEDNGEYFRTRDGIRLEDNVYHSLLEQSVGTEFDGSIEKISGQRFPDIVVKNYFGVEVKSTLQNHWSTTGNSVLESTRVDNIERIYLYFGKLSTPVGFRWKRYEECLKEVVVTHSPRYLIDMDLLPGDTIFEKMGISYDKIRKEPNPIKPIINHYRSQLKPGEDLWWLDSNPPKEAEDTQPATSFNLRLWNNLGEGERYNLTNKIMALFPQIFGKSNSKYNSVASWLVVRNGVLHPNVRDSFSAGGQLALPSPFSGFGLLPRVFTHLYENFDQIIHYVNSSNSEDLSIYWNVKYISDMRANQWINLVADYASEILPRDKNIKRVLLARLNK